MVMTAIILYLSYRMQQKVVEMIDADLSNLIHSVHSSSQRLSTVKNSDRDSLKSFIRSAVQNPAVREVSVINKNHEVVASSNPRKIGKKHAVDNRLLLVREERGVDSPANHHDWGAVSIAMQITRNAKWKDGVYKDIFIKAQAAAPAGSTLIGKHPDFQALVKIVPDDCLLCHVRDSRVAPPFTKLLHAIHLTGGQENPFLSKASGTCTSCHKLDQKTGTWLLGSGVEK